MSVSAVNAFRLRPGVSAADFERFSVELDRPTCLAFDVVVDFEVYHVERTDPSGVDVVEVMTVTSWSEWERVRDTAPELVPVVERFEQLVEPGSVSTLLTHKSPLPQEI
ncbi:hypothetical protein [Mycolicibacterium sp. 050158]|jgi:REDY-like protein HapK|uniref:hypothetical protein n=1 Tax=Mycolicibacterium sp. 050158 TaxID=3090602 RepID=UPI00299F4F19|nr:hypothetical protein [Mycolicibacterium sp. 050158]MDX1891456.1 hypothetical protein [Mycolicibacterium sp. 050158]